MKRTCAQVIHPPPPPPHCTHTPSPPPPPKKKHTNKQYGRVARQLTRNRHSSPLFLRQPPFQWYPYTSITQLTQVHQPHDLFHMLVDQRHGDLPGQGGAGCMFDGFLNGGAWVQGIDLFHIAHHVMEGIRVKGVAIDSHVPFNKTTWNCVCVGGRSW